MALAILFSVSQGTYALPCQSVMEVVPWLELRPVPQASAWLAGTFAYHGALVSVMDACQFLGGYPCARRLSSRIALVRCFLTEVGEVITGVLAERMTAVKRLDGDMLVANDPSPLAYLGGVVQQGTDLVQLVDVEGLVRAMRPHLTPFPLLPAGGTSDPD
jgi:chemotaxis-related protein WspB